MKSLKHVFLTRVYQRLLGTEWGAVQRYAKRREYYTANQSAGARYAGFRCFNGGR